MILGERIYDRSGLAAPIFFIFFSEYLLLAVQTLSFFVLLGQVSKVIRNGFSSIKSGVFGGDLTFYQIGLYLR
jgi:hypothetical protein